MTRLTSYISNTREYCGRSAVSELRGWKSVRNIFYTMTLCSVCMTAGCFSSGGTYNSLGECQDDLIDKGASAEEIAKTCNEYID